MTSLWWGTAMTGWLGSNALSPQTAMLWGRFAPPQPPAWPPLGHVVSRGVLAAAETSGTWRALEFDLPEASWEWILYGAGFALVLALAVSVYVRDTRGLSGFWKFWLCGLRLAVLAVLVVIAINPQQRTQKLSNRPSRVALLLDTSLSMRYPEAASSGNESPVGRTAADSRAEAVAQLLSRSPLLDLLRKRHQVSVYTFDSKLSGPHHVLHRADDAVRAGAPATGETSPGTPAAEQTGTPRPSEPQPQRRSQPEPGNETEAKTAVESTETPLNWQKLLEPRGLETRLGESLLDLLRQVSGRTLSGILVVTDGASNAGVEPSTANSVANASQPKVRLISVGVGSTEQPVNLQVANLQAPTDVHVGDAYEISAFVQGQGLAGRSVQVDLLVKPNDDTREPPTLIESREVTLREDGIPVEVTFRRTPSVAGNVEYDVRATPTIPVRELDDADNERRKTINIVDRKTRVLLVAGGPMRDYRFVRILLYRHPAVQVDVWLQSVRPSDIGQVSQESDNLLVSFPQSATELFDYDVIAAFDPDWSRLSAEQRQLLVDWVGEHAGGLILVAGDIYTSELAAPQRDSNSDDELQPIRDLYPVFLNPSLLDVNIGNASTQAWPVKLTEEGRGAGFLQLTDDAATSADVWKEFPGVFRCYPTGGAKAGATVYAYFSDPRSQTEHGLPVLLASQFYGAGRTLYLGSPEMWRLRALSEEFYDRFWIKAVREVGQGRLKRGNLRGLLLLERDQYYLGETVRVRAQLLDPQLKPLDERRAVMEVFTPQGRPLVPNRVLRADPQRPGQYVGDFRATQSGTYRIEVPIPASRNRLTGAVDVVLPTLESHQIRQNAKLLADLVRDTGGRYLPINDFEALLTGAGAEKRLSELFPNRGEQVLVDERLVSLWDRRWVLFLLVGVLSAEWLTRKLLKLA